LVIGENKVGNRHHHLPPALKHAAYSATNILPGENAAEFAKLERDLIAEFGADGALENQILADMSRYVWRKRNLATFRIAQLAQARWEEIEYEKVPHDKIEYMGIPMLGGEKVIERVDPVVRDAALRAAKVQAHKELGEAYGLIEIGDTATIDHLMKELEIQDRLDAKIERCIKQLLLVRGLKSVSSRSSTAASQPPAKRLTAA
jgi:hypothetical protein